MHIEMFLKDVDWDMPFRDVLDDPKSSPLERKLARMVLDEDDDHAFLTIRMLYRDYQRMVDEARRSVPHVDRFNVYEREDISSNALAMNILLALKVYPTGWCATKLVWLGDLVRARVWLRQSASMLGGVLSPFGTQPDLIYTDPRFSIEG